MAPFPASPQGVARTLRRGLRAVAAPVLERRHLLPEPVERVIQHVRWAGRPPADLVPPPRPDGGRGLLVAPANFAGQGWQWARAYERWTGRPAACWMYRTDPVFAFPADWGPSVAVNRAPRRWQRAQLDLVTACFDTVVIEAGRPLFGRLLGFDPVREAQVLRARGLRVALLWHGTDVRLPSEHAATHPLSPYAGALDAGHVGRLEATARRNRRRLARFDGPTLVSTPDLLADVPEADWCPVVVDVGAWASDVPLLERERPVVVHVPSSVALKGTDLVRDVLLDLDRQGVVEYREAAGLPSAEVRDLYRSADVVLDQFRLGIYGVAACEAMAAGRLVLSHVDASVRATVRARTGLDLPVVETPADEVRARLLDVVARREHHRALAARGPAFVAEVHDGRRSAAVLARLSGAAPEAGDRGTVD